MTNTTFPYLYEFRQLAEWPVSASLQRYYFPGASTTAGRDGILVEIRPDFGQSWLGMFAFGEIAPMGASGIFTTPNPHRLCIVAKGAGYFVSANEPTSWEPVRVVPIIDVHPIPAHEIIVFAEHTRLVSYGRLGIKWATKRLSWDNLRITEITETVVKGEFWDIRSEETANFVVDLATGIHRGGIDEP